MKVNNCNNSPSRLLCLLGGGGNTAPEGHLTMSFQADVSCVLLVQYYVPLGANLITLKAGGKENHNKQDKCYTAAYLQV